MLFKCFPYPKSALQSDPLSWFTCSIGLSLPSGTASAPSVLSFFPSDMDECDSFASATSLLLDEGRLGSGPFHPPHLPQRYPTVSDLSPGGARPLCALQCRQINAYRFSAAFSSSPTNKSRIRSRNVFDCGSTTGRTGEGGGLKADGWNCGTFCGGVGMND